MTEDQPQSFYSVHPPEDDHGDPELGAAIGEVGGRLMDLLEVGRDPQTDAEHQRLEHRVTELRARHEPD